MNAPIDSDVARLVEAFKKDGRTGAQAVWVEIHAARKLKLWESSALAEKFRAALTAAGMKP